MHSDPPWLALALALALARLFAELFQRGRLPPVLGELVAGILLGNLGLIGLGDLGGSLRQDPQVAFLAELGAVVLLFQVGLESDAAELLKAGWEATRVAVIGVVVPMALGIGAMALLRPESTTMERVFVGSVLCATSVGITARVLRDLGRLATVEARVILGAAVIDDVLGLIVLAVVLGLAVSGSTNVLAIGRLIGVSLAFLVGGFIAGRYLARHLLRVAARGVTSGRGLAVALAICFVAAWGAHAVGLAPIVGAFAAGLMLDPLFEGELLATGESEIRQRVEALGTFLVPIFFVRMGAACDLGALGGGTLVIAGALSLAAVLGKQACSLVTSRGTDRWAVGIGMIPRGEVGLIVAFQGTMTTSGGRPLVDPSTFAALVVMVLVSTLVTPPILAWRLRRLPPSPSVPIASG